MHDTDVLLRRTDVADILERDPGMAGFEQHRQHLAPQILSFDAFKQLQLAIAGLFFQRFILLFEGAAIEIVQITGITW